MPADVTNRAGEGMNKPVEHAGWRRYRLPLLLAVVALCLYGGSIAWFVFGR